MYDLRPKGLLDLAGTASLRRSLLKILPEQPRVLLLSLDDVEVLDPHHLAILPTLDKRAMRDCGARLDCYASPQTKIGRRILEAISWRVALHSSRAAALATADAKTAATHRAYRWLPADDDAIRDARSTVRDCCRRWAIAQIADTAQLVVAELVADALQTQTGLHLILTHRGAQLHLQVRGDHRIGGRDILLVALLSSAYGTTVGTEATTRWAALRVRPAG